MVENSKAKKSVIFKTNLPLVKHQRVQNSTPIEEGDNSEYNFEKQRASKALGKLAKGSSRIILDIKAVFPFNLFPDELIIDETKVSVHTKYFFHTKQVSSMEYNDIFNVVIQQGIFFAKLEIFDRFFYQQRISIEFLKKKEAILARRIIQGLIIAKKERINTQDLPMEELVQKLERIGQTR